MNNITFIIIILCFAIQIIYWIASAPAAKKTSENRGGWTMRISALIIVGSVIFLTKQIAVVIPFFNTSFYSYSLITGIIADVVTLLGMMTMISARTALGKNWSANVTFKEDHELITRGPYAYVRHPIYSGLCLMILGAAIHWGNFAGFFLFILFFIGAHYKGYKEEKLLLEHFPETYPTYMKKVPALVPFV